MHAEDASGRFHRACTSADVLETVVDGLVNGVERLSQAGLVKGKTVGIDATTLEANAAMRSIERRNTGESYEAFVGRLAEAAP